MASGWRMRKIKLSDIGNAILLPTGPVGYLSLISWLLSHSP